MKALSWRPVVPSVIVGLATVALEIAYGAPVGGALVYVAYEAGFVVVPGWLAYRMLTRRPGGSLRQLALGWALGYVLEVLAFMLTAATGVRSLFVAYPVLIGGGALVARRRRLLRPAVQEPLARRLVWLVALVCIGAVTYIALSYFPATPLPGATAVNYSSDNAWALSLAAEAKHHWPIQDPNVVGEPMAYHYFVHIHLAAASQVTGLELPLVYFRLFICPLVIALVLSMVVAGQSLARSAYAGLVAACVTMFVGQLQLDTRASLLGRASFLGVFFTLMVTSPSFLFGLVLFVPLFILIGERVSRRDGVAGRRDWVLVTLFMVGAAGAKVSILPLVLVALPIYGGFRWLLERRVPASVWSAAGLALVVSGADYLLQYRAHSSGLGIAPFSIFDEMPAVVSVRRALSDALPAFPGEATALSVAGIVFGSLGLLAAPLAGVPWLARGRRSRLGAEQAWLLSLLVAGLLALVTLSGEGSGNQLYFLFYGLVAGSVLSGDGLRVAWVRRPALTRRTRRIAGLALAWLTVLVVLILVALHLRTASGVVQEGRVDLFLYGAFAASLVLLYLGAKRWGGPTRWAAAALVSVALLLVGALDTPINSLSALTSRPVPPSEGRRMTPQIYDALRWIRDKSSPDTVIAVNNRNQLEFNYAAFSERPVFLGGWAASQRSRDQGYAQVINGTINPFADRLRLNDAVFARGDRAALRVMTAQYRVRYLVIDKINGYPTDLRALTPAGVLVFRAPDVLVLRTS